MGTKLVIIGGIAAGATAAARARRLSESASITLVERGASVSFATCGMPYHLSGRIQQRGKLAVQTPESLLRRYRIVVRTSTEAVRLDLGGRRVLVRGPVGEEWLEYDSLILAQGAKPVVPPIPGAEGVRTLRGAEDMDRLADLLDAGPKTAVILGGGFIGLELAEALTERGLAVTIVERLPTVLPALDLDFGTLVGEVLGSNGVRVLAGSQAARILPGAVELADGIRLPADLVVAATGTRPESDLAAEAGLALGPRGGLAVDEYLASSDPRVFGAGDMIECRSAVTGKPGRFALAGPANRQGRVAAENALGGRVRYGGAQGTFACKVFGHTVAMTGLGERSAGEAGFDAGAAIVHKENHASYYPGARELCLKLVYDRVTGRLLGAQCFGEEGVDKRIDAAAVALRMGARLEDLAGVDFAYAPPYSSANDPLNMAAFVGANDVSGFCRAVPPSRLAEALAEGESVLLDVRSPAEVARGQVAGSLNIPLDDLRGRLGEVPRGKRVFVLCKSGYRAHLAARILMANGFSEVSNVTGGFSSARLEGALRIVGG